MAHISNCVMSRVILLMVLIVGLLMAAEARIQDGEFTQTAPAPAPSMDAGAGFLITYSGTFVCSSIILSLSALLSH